MWTPEATVLMSLFFLIKNKMNCKHPIREAQWDHWRFLGLDTIEELLRGCGKINHNERDSELAFILHSSFVCPPCRLRAALLGLNSFPSKLFLFLTCKALWMDLWKASTLVPRSAKGLTTRWVAADAFSHLEEAKSLAKDTPKLGTVLIQ